MTELEFEEISIISLEKRSLANILRVKEIYGIRGKELLENMYLADKLQEQLDELELLEGMNKEERIFYKKNKIKKEIEILKKRARLYE